jgi:hypothetical protein
MTRNNSAAEQHLEGVLREKRRDHMENQIFGWVDLVVDTAEMAAIISGLILLSRVHRNIVSLLRVIRRMDRKTADTTGSEYRPLTNVEVWREIPRCGGSDF